MKLNKPLSDLVVSRKVAQQLNPLLDKAGIEVRGNFTWERCEIINVFGNVFTDWKAKYKGYPIWKIKDIKNIESIPTYLLEEVLGVLPRSVLQFKGKYNSDRYHFSLSHNGCGYFRRDRCLMSFVSLKSDATAAAKLLIWAIENGYLSCTDGTQNS